MQSNENRDVLKFVGVQDKVINDMAQVICEYVPMNQLQMQEHIRLSILKWQRENENDFSNIAKFSPIQRIETLDDILQKLKNEITDIYHGKYSPDALEVAIDKSMEFFIDNYVDEKL